jgi:hypothetical protein
MSICWISLTQTLFCVEKEINFYVKLYMKIRLQCVKILTVTEEIVLQFNVRKFNITPHLDSWTEHLVISL